MGRGSHGPSPRKGCLAVRWTAVAVSVTVLTLASGCGSRLTSSAGRPSATSIPRAASTPSTPSTPSTASTPRTPTPGLADRAGLEGPYRITKVVDGDTDKITVNGRTVKLRLIGIDTPETRDPRKPVQCFGPQASARAHQLLDGRSVWIQYDSSQDRRDVYGRALVYVWLDSQTMFNEVMVAEGYAHEYTYDQPYRYQRQFRAAQSKAKDAQLGFWNRGSCSGDTTQRATAAPVASPPVLAVSPSAGSQGVGVYYSSCSKVRAAGKAPLLRDEPGYRSGLDGDHNGVACQ